MIELHLNNIIIGYGNTFSTHVNSNIIIHGHIIINKFKPPIYIYLKTGCLNTSNPNRFRIIYHFYI